jgi:hypothetical protein
MTTGGADVDIEMALPPASVKPQASADAAQAQPPAEEPFGKIRLHGTEVLTNDAAVIVSLRNVHKTYLLGIEGVPALRCAALFRSRVTLFSRFCGTQRSQRQREAGRVRLRLRHKRRGQDHSPEHRRHHRPPHQGRALPLRHLCGHPISSLLGRPPTAFGQTSRRGPPTRSFRSCDSSICAPCLSFREDSSPAASAPV